MVPPIRFEGYVEGAEQEKQYFKRLEQIIKKETGANQTVMFAFRTNRGSDPFTVAKKAKDCCGLADYKLLTKEKRLIAVFDYDNKKEQFIKALEFCKKNKIVPAYSNFSFDLWLILHKEYRVPRVNSSDGYTKLLRELYDVPNEIDIKCKRANEIIMSKIGIDDVRTAIRYAKNINETNMESGKVLFDCSGELHYEQPALKINEFVEEVLDRCGISYTK